MRVFDERREDFADGQVLAAIDEAPTIGDPFGDQSVVPLEALGRTVLAQLKLAALERHRGEAATLVQPVFGTGFGVRHGVNLPGGTSTTPIKVHG